MTNYFIKLFEDSILLKKILEERPTAYCLLTLVAIRARKTDLFDEKGNKINDGIEVGEALIGDYEKYGATEQIYRTDKKYLEKLKILTFKSTSKGTIAKIVSSSIFDISRSKPTNQLTYSQRTNNDQLTTKQEVRSKKLEANNIYNGQVYEKLDHSSFVINYYLSKYKEYLEKQHPNLKSNQLERIKEVFNDFTKDWNLSSNEWQVIIDAHFNRKINTDYNINHFATDGILRNLYYQKLY